MKVLFDIVHPMNVYLFKDVIAQLRRDGHEYLITTRDKDETNVLLKRLGLEFTCISRMGRGPIGMGLELVRRTARLAGIARRYRPDVMVGETGISVAWAGRLLGIPSIVVDMTEFAWLQLSLFTPLATVICSGLGYGRRFPGRQGQRHLVYHAPPALAYTHPRRFQPDSQVLRRYGVEPDQPFVVLRLKAWRAMHDFGVSGPEDHELLRLVRALAELNGGSRPIISSERPLPDSLAGFANPVPVEHMLHLLAFSRLYVGEGSCMAAEAACLGRPAIFLSPKSRRGYLDGMERNRYALVSTVNTAAQTLEQARRWLTDPALPDRCRTAQRRLLQECQDPVPFLSEVIQRVGQGKDARRNRSSVR